jgi:hypothetical protein
MVNVSDVLAMGGRRWRWWTRWVHGAAARPC